MTTEIIQVSHTLKTKQNNTKQNKKQNKEKHQPKNRTALASISTVRYEYFILLNFTGSFSVDAVLLNSDPKRKLYI